MELLRVLHILLDVLGAETSDESAYMVLGEKHQQRTVLTQRNVHVQAITYLWLVSKLASVDVERPMDAKFDGKEASEAYELDTMEMLGTVVGELLDKRPVSIQGFAAGMFERRGRQ